jgi:transposase
MEQHIIYVGLNMHKDTIAIALAQGSRRSEVREHGKVANTPAALNTLCARLARNGAKQRFCHEAGPCGYGIQRQLSEAGHECAVVAPFLIPRKSGDRIKTDRRDAINLAKLRRAGELTSVWIPDPGHEAIRDLVRARLAAALVELDQPLNPQSQITADRSQSQRDDLAKHSLIWSTTTRQNELCGSPKPLMTWK